MKDEIIKRTYQIYKSRGADNGKDIDDWLQAEKEVFPVHRASFRL